MTMFIFLVGKVENIEQGTRNGNIEQGTGLSD
jgi:hypothetical protein